MNIICIWHWMWQLGISPGRLLDNEKLSSFFEILTTSYDDNDKVIVYTSVMLKLTLNNKSHKSSLLIHDLLLILPGICIHSTFMELSCDCLPMASRGDPSMFAWCHWTSISKFYIIDSMIHTKFYNFTNDVTENCFWMGLTKDTTHRGCHPSDSICCKLFGQVRTQNLFIYYSYAPHSTTNFCV